MITFSGISKRFNNLQVLEDISGSFKQGITNLIIGGSGSGKTVLMKCLVGLIPPDQGEVYYDGELFKTSSRVEARKIRRRIGMLFQGVALFDSKSVEENVRFPLDILTHMEAKEKQERVNFCLDRVGLAGTNDKLPSELSGGMKKRVGLARAIVNRPRYLFCDEPNSGLDPQTAIRIDQLIQSITEESNIVTVVITHDMNSLMEIGSHVMFIYAGTKAWEGTKDDILHSSVPSLQDFVLSSKLIRALKER